MMQPIPVEEIQEPYDLSIVTNDQLTLIWEGVKKYLDRSCKRSNGRLTPDDIFYDCLNNIKSLWIIFDKESFDIKGVVVTEFINYPTGKKMLSLEHITGNKMEDWVDMLIDALEDYAVLNQCNGIEGIGRAGFWHWVKDRDNWNKLAIFYEYTIEVENEKI